MFFILMSNLKEKIIFVCFALCCLTQAFNIYLDYKVKEDYREILSKISDTHCDILQKLIYPVEEFVGDEGIADLEEEEQ